MSGVRVDRLKKARDWALAHPEKFNMNSWGKVFANANSGELCGTTKCLAGYGASKRHPKQWKLAVEKALVVAMEDGSGRETISTLPNGKSVEAVGQEWFGLGAAQAHRLFFADLSEDQWLDVINQLIEEHS